MGCGWTVHFLTESFGWSLPDAYRGIFYGYSALGALKFILVMFLGRAVEVDEKHLLPAETGETSPLLAQAPAPEQPKAKPKLWNILPDIDKKSLPVIIPLCLLFSLDAFASGVATMFVPLKDLPRSNS